MNNFPTKQTVIIYNGTNHPINIYKLEDCLQNRHGQYFLKDPAIKPLSTYCQERPLSVTTNKVPGCSIDGVLYCPPDIYTRPIDILPNANFYDTVIVSSLYAAHARLALANFPDYLDRLFTPITVYASDPQKSRADKLGAVGFQKAFYIRTPQDYSLMLQRGERPSRSALEATFTAYSNPGIMLDYVTSCCLQQLRGYLANTN